ncbi:MAG: CocE/NonD family hydrolase, partial [Planctomycetia bacterium]|nr:CocE/NonD family hydrolase [Planctomycetia bacterium]
ADMNDALMRLPLSDIDEAIGWPMPWLDAYLTHPEPNGFWTRLDLTSRLPELQLPALHVVGYYDFFSRESVDNFVIMQRHARDPQTRRQQRLILGPWDHGTIGKSQVAEVDFGPEAALDIAAIQFDWFERHLKQDAAAQAKPFPPVRYFSMGDNVWRDAQQWPPEGVTPTSFFLHSDGKANTRKGTGRLSREAPTKEQPADTFRATDPADQATKMRWNIDWGDGTTETLSQAARFSHKHKYTQPGDYLIRATATDRDGLTSSIATFRVHVESAINPASLLSELLASGQI